MRRRSAEVCVYVPTTVALYILNHKRDSLAQLEVRYGVHVLVARDDALIPPAFRLERLRACEPGDAAPVAMVPLTQTPQIEEEEPADEDAEEAAAGETQTGETGTGAAERRGQDDEEERGRSRRRRRRRRRHDDDRGAPTAARAAEEGEEPAAEPIAAAGEMRNGKAEQGEDEQGEEDHAEAPGEDDKLRRRRGRRGGRRRGRRDEGEGASFDDPRPALLTVEIAAAPAPGEAENGELAAERAAAPVAWSWPADAPADTSGLAEPATAAEMEIASLPELAGEGLPRRSEPAAVVGPQNPPQTTLDENDAEQGAAEHGRFWPPLAGGREPATQAGGELSLAAFPHGAAEPRVVEQSERGREDQEQDERPHDKPEPGLAATPADPDIPGASAPQLEPEPAIQTITKKPPSPRKGWWQRLIQP